MVFPCYCQIGMQTACTLGYALLVLVLIRSGAWARVPLFSLFAAAMVPSMYWWDPAKVSGLTWAGAGLLIGKFLVTGEAFWICTEWLSPTERKRLLVFCAAIAVLGVWITARMYTDLSPLGIYRATRQHVHTSLSMMLLAGAGCLWVRPCRIPRPRQQHALVLLAYMLIHAGTGLMWGIIRPAGGTVSDHQAIQQLYLLGCCVCIVAWCLTWRVAIQRPNPQLEPPDAVLQG